MFITDVLEEVRDPLPASMPPGFKAWARIDTSDPWFQFNVSEETSAGSSSFVILLSNPLDVWRTTRSFSAREGAVLGAVKVTTPGDVNGSGKWRQDVLLELMVAVDEKASSSRLIYLTDSGMYGLEPGTQLSNYAIKTIYVAPSQAVELFDLSRYSFLIKENTATERAP
ncbi:hypothetical protein K5D57_10770 [Pseudomonas cichorii]|nr:hypothetical protein [Pseudomonas cichorii]